MSWDGILNYLPPLLLLLKGPEICLHNRQNLLKFDKTSLYLNFQLLVSFSLALVLKIQFLLFEQNFKPYQCFFLIQEMYLCIFKTLILGIEQSCEAENFVVLIHSSRRSILQGFTQNQRPGPSRGRSGGGYFRIPSQDILQPVDPSLKVSFS